MVVVFFFFFEGSYIRGGGRIREDLEDLQGEGSDSTILLKNY